MYAILLQYSMLIEAENASQLKMVQGDYLAKEVSLPSPDPGDILAIHDTGAYTMSMYCRYFLVFLISLISAVTLR